MDTVPGIDVSHWQGSINWPQVGAAGYEFAVLKATESTNYVDPSFAANRARARAAGLLVGAYHFARAGDPVAEANAFIAAVGSLAADEFAVLDWEVSPAGVDAVSWCAAFCTAVKNRTGRLPLLYLNGPRVARDDWSPLVQMGVRLWLAGDGVNARYDNDPKLVTVKWWGAPAIKQFSESGAVPSIGGGVDLNVFYGDKTALTALAAGNEQEEDMANSDDILKTVQNIEFHLLGAHVAERGQDMLQWIEDALYGNMPPGLNNFHWLGAQIAALTAIVQAIASTPGGLDAGQMTAAAKAGADQALAELADRLKPTP